MTEQEEYEQYLVETGQKAPVKPAPNLMDADYLQRMNEGIYGEGGLTPEKVGAAANNALSMGGGATLLKAIPAVSKLTGLAGLLGRGATAIGEGAAMGAAQSPNDRALGALVGGGTQGVLHAGGELTNAIRKGLSSASKQAAVNKAVSTGKSGEMLLGQADDAANRLRGEISGHENELAGALSPEGYEVNPDMVADVFPNYAKRLATKRPMVETPGALGEPVLQQATQGRVPISDKQTRRLWKAANKASQFSPSDVMNPVAKAKSESAEALGDTIRREVYGKTPEAQGIMEQMGQDIQAKNYLTGKAVQKNPQAALSAEKLGTKKMEALMDIDRRVGTDLAATGERMATARNLSKPLELDMPSAGRLLKRGAYAAAPGADKLAQFFGKVSSPLTETSGRQAAIMSGRREEPSAQELDEYEQYLRETGQK